MTYEQEGSGIKVYFLRGNNYLQPRLRGFRDSGSGLGGGYILGVIIRNTRDDIGLGIQGLRIRAVDILPQHWRIKLKKTENQMETGVIGLIGIGVRERCGSLCRVHIIIRIIVYSDLCWGPLFWKLQSHRVRKSQKQDTYTSHIRVLGSRV